MGEAKLLPCPFCGSAPKAFGEFIECSNADCAASWGSDIEHWNRRAPDPLKAELVEALTKADRTFEALSKYFGPDETAGRIIANARAALARAREGEKR